MKIDITCPVELLRFEQADFGEGRRQAYLTFLNESPYVITAVSGILSLLDDEQMAIEERRISFGPIAAQPAEPFTCPMALDGFPAFVSATMLIEDVVFDGEEPWAMHPSRLRDLTPPILEEGTARNALIAVAGHDAVCYPTYENNMWLCVCGRYNRWRWMTCRRCRRDRDTVLSAYAPDKVGAAFEARMRAEDEEDEERMVRKPPARRQQSRRAELPPEPAPPRTKAEAEKRASSAKRQQAAQRPPKKKRTVAQKVPDETKKPTAQRGAVAILAVVLGTLILWGTMSLVNRMSRPIQTSVDTAGIDLEAL